MNNGFLYQVVKSFKYAVDEIESSEMLKTSSIAWMFGVLTITSFIFSSAVVYGYLGVIGRLDLFLPSLSELGLVLHYWLPIYAFWAILSITTFLTSSLLMRLSISFVGEGEKGRGVRDDVSHFILKIQFYGLLFFWASFFILMWLDMFYFYVR